MSLVLNLLSLMPADAISIEKRELAITRPLSLFQWLDWLNQHPPAAIALLVLVNLACHWQTLGGYYLADDFVHVAWLKEVFSGRPELLLKNFYSTWLQTEGTNFYRPLISITLAADRLLFGSSPVGYHLSNLLYQCLSTIGLYLVVSECLFLFFKTHRKNALAGQSSTKSGGEAVTYLPLVTALLFAVHPLHAEVVSWIIARVDSVCCAFYLLSMWLFLRARRLDQANKLWLLSLVFFILSLISKEMAVTLPPSLVVLLILFPEKEGKWISSVKNAFMATWPMWLVLVLYLGFRALALGSVTGGYQGSIGEGLSQSTLSRILSLPSLERVVMPLNAEVFRPLRRLVLPLAIVYGLGLLGLILRLAIGKQPFKPSAKIVAFAALWFVLVMVPAIPVWNLTETLQGSRFIYIGTAPLCLLLAAFFSPIRKQTSEPASPRMVALHGLSTVPAIALAVLYGFITFGNNGAWVSAGNELRALRDSLDAEIRNIPEPGKLALLNLPQKYRGAHMLYNAATLSVLLGPPLSEYDFSSRVITFEPVLFGDDDLIRISRVREMIEPGRSNQFVYWDREQRKLTRIELTNEYREVKLDSQCQGLRATDIDSRGNPTRPAEGAVVPSGPSRSVDRNTVLVSPVLDVEPAGVDFLDICLSARSHNASTTGNTGSTPMVPIVIQTKSSESSPLRGLITVFPLDGKAYKMRIHVSEHKKWLSEGRVHRLAISSPAPGVTVTVHGLALLSGRTAIPSLTPAGKNFTEDNSGVVRAFGKAGHFNYDASAIPGACAVVFEISKPNAWFDHYTNTYRDSSQSPKALKSWTSPNLSGNNQALDLKQLKDPGFYELRIAAVGKQGEVVGYFSDPIMFQRGH